MYKRLAVAQLQLLTALHHCRTMSVPISLVAVMDQNFLDFVHTDHSIREKGIINDQNGLKNWSTVSCSSGKVRDCLRQRALLDRMRSSLLTFHNHSDSINFSR